MPTDVDMSHFADEIRSELNDNLLPFWRERSVDTRSGGFLGEMDFTSQVIDGTNKGLILNSRLLWTFSALSRATAHPLDQQLADRAVGFLNDHFLDRQHGGYYWEVSNDGQVIDSLKRVYGQAFCIYALAERYLANHEESAKASAVRLFELLEVHARDPVSGGYFEVCNADWSLAATERLSNKDEAAPKSMNNHLHILEAYTNLLRIWHDKQLEKAIHDLLEMFDRHILNVNKDHQRHFFAGDWTSLAESYTYGHDIEAAWLLCEAAEVLQDTDLIRMTESWAMLLATSVLLEGIDDDGGLLYEGDAGRAIDRGKEWWPQAEAVVGFLQAYQISNDPVFMKAAHRVWNYICEHIVDQKHGEWHWRVSPDGTLDQTLPKLSAWKGPYHNVRMCLEALRRLEYLIQQEE